MNQMDKRDEMQMEAQMAYVLDEITLHDNMKEDGMARIGALWADIVSGRLPLIKDSDGNPREGISPITRYHRWSPEDPAAECDFTIMAVDSSFFPDMARNPEYACYRGSGASLEDAATGAWMQVDQDTKSGRIKPLYTDDYESTVPPEFTKDGQWNCVLYVHVQPQES